MSRKIREGYRRLIAFVLSMVLVVSNISANTGIVYAAEKEEESDIALFMLDEGRSWTRSGTWTARGALSWKTWSWRLPKSR